MLGARVVGSTSGPVELAQERGRLTTACVGRSVALPPSGGEMDRQREGCENNEITRMHVFLFITITPYAMQCNVAGGLGEYLPPLLAGTFPTIRALLCGRPCLDSVCASTPILDIDLDALAAFIRVRGASALVIGRRLCKILLYVGLVIWEE